MLDMAVLDIDLRASARRRPRACEAAADACGMRGTTNCSLALHQALHYVGKIPARFSILVSLIAGSKNPASLVEA